MLDELQWPNLQERATAGFYKIHNNLAIIDKSRYLSVAGEGGGSRTRPHPFQYHRSNAYTDDLKSSFFPRTVATWNGLTTETVFAETVDVFKAKI